MTPFGSMPTRTLIGFPEYPVALANLLGHASELA
jgi:hypothetical protein